MGVRINKKNPLWQVLQKISWAVFQTRYVVVDRLCDQWRLRDYVDDIRSTEILSDQKEGTFGLFVFYEPNGEVSNSVRRIISALAGSDVQILLCCNHDLSDAQLTFFRQNCHTIILRGNQGFDFGCYKDAIKHMREHDLKPDRLIVLNDSVFFASTGLKEFVDDLQQHDDVIAAYENWGEDYHLQSFALSVSGRVFQSAPFQEFWKNYVPSNNRVLAIDLGEKGLTRAILKSARSTRVLYSVDELHSILVERGGVEEEMLTAVLPWPAKETLGPAPKDSQDRIMEICRQLGTTSTIHSGAYFFPKYMGSPLFKKDLVYRRRFTLWEVGVWTKELMPRDEREEFLNLLRLKGDSSQFSILDSFKFTYGLK